MTKTGGLAWSQTGSQITGFNNRRLILGVPFFTEVAPLTGPMYQLFVFFMITDPATTVKNKKGQILVAFLIALVEFVLRLNEFIYAPFYALFLVGPIAMVIHLQLKHQKSAAASQARSPQD